jgi:hypothetical protein
LNVSEFFSIEKRSKNPQGIQSMGATTCQQGNIHLIGVSASYAEAISRVTAESLGKALNLLQLSTTSYPTWLGKTGSDTGIHCLMQWYLRGWRAM